MNIAIEKIKSSRRICRLAFGQPQHAFSIDGAKQL